jgi:hypothetical protein
MMALRNMRGETRELTEQIGLKWRRFNPMLIVHLEMRRNSFHRMFRFRQIETLFVRF